MEWAQAFRPLLGSILDKSRPFGHFLGPPWGAGQTSPGLSATLWVILVGKPNKSRPFRPLLWPILGGGEKQVQAFPPLLGPILGGGANKSRPFGHFLGLSWGEGKQVQAFRPLPTAGQTSPGLSATSWALLGGGANKSRPSGHFLGSSWGAGQTSPQACRPLRGAAQTSVGQTSPRHSRAVWTCLPRPPKWPKGLGLVHPNPPKTHPKPIPNPLETLAGVANPLHPRIKQDFLNICPFHLLIAPPNHTPARRTSKPNTPLQDPPRRTSKAKHAALQAKTLL